MQISFATLAIPPFWEKEAVFLVESLRTLGGRLAQQPVTLLTIKGKPLGTKSMKRLDELRVSCPEFEIDAESLNFPLAVVAHGAAAAERHSPAQTDCLVWLLPDTLILREPSAFRLPAGSQLGFRPVHHQNIGSGYTQAPDAFWQKIYQHCDVPQDHIFPMQTCYRELVRPYFNAGMLAARPADQLLGHWLDAFQRTFQHPDFLPFFKIRKYAIFMHQAILAGVILKNFSPDHLVELPENYNYPLHMHNRYPEQARVGSLEQLVTVRYEKASLLPKLLKEIQISPARSEWFKERKLLK